MGLFLFITAVIAFSLFWGKIVYFTQSTTFFRKLVFTLMGYGTYTYEQIESMMLTVLYYISGIMGCVIFINMYDVSIKDFMLIPDYFFALLALGIIGEISLSNLFTRAVFSIGKDNIDVGGEIGRVTWIAGIRRLPHNIRIIAPAISGFIEETFFRGVVIYILIKVFAVSEFVSIAIVTALFIFEQLVQLDTRMQKLIIGLSSVSISVVGGILFVITNSVLVAAVVHAFFVIFYFSSMETNRKVTYSYNRG